MFGDSMLFVAIKEHFIKYTNILFFLLTFSDIFCCCGPYSYNSYHIFSHIAITEDQEEDEEDEDSDDMAYVHLSSILDG